MTGVVALSCTFTEYDLSVAIGVYTQAFGVGFVTQVIGIALFENVYVYGAVPPDTDAVSVSDCPRSTVELDNDNVGVPSAMLTFDFLDAFEIVLAPLLSESRILYL